MYTLAFFLDSTSMTSCLKCKCVTDDKNKCLIMVTRTVRFPEKAVLLECFWKGYSSWTPPSISPPLTHSVPFCAAFHCPALLLACSVWFYLSFPVHTTGPRWVSHHPVSLPGSHVALHLSVLNLCLWTNGFGGSGLALRMSSHFQGRNLENSSSLEPNNMPRPVAQRTSFSGIQHCYVLR